MRLLQGPAGCPRRRARAGGPVTSAPPSRSLQVNLVRGCGPAPAGSTFGEEPAGAGRGAFSFASLTSTDPSPPTSAPERQRSQGALQAESCANCKPRVAPTELQVKGRDTRPIRSVSTPRRRNDLGRGEAVLCCSPFPGPCGAPGVQMQAAIPPPIWRTRVVLVGDRGVDFILRFENVRCRFSALGGLRSVRRHAHRANPRAISQRCPSRSRAHPLLPR
jgi:hypothetical protein